MSRKMPGDPVARGDLPCERQAMAFVLTPERALWRGATRTLYIADPHFGKAAVYRSLGQPVPHGTTAQTLAVLTGVMHRFNPRRLVILGDFLHARGAQRASVIDALAQWRANCSAVACLLVRGNHDAHAGDPPAILEIDIVNGPWIDQGLAACHEPPTLLVAGSGPIDPATNRYMYTLAGHIHPVVRLRGGGRDSVRLPCFDMGPHVGVLPAFGAFTGGWPIARQPGHMLGVVADDRVFSYGGD